MGHVFITRTVPGRAVELLEDAGHTVETWPGELPPPPAELLEKLRDADGVMSMVTDPLNRVVFEAAPKLRIAANMAVGYDNIEAPAAAELGVWATNTPGVLAETTAELAFALILDAARNVSRSARETLEGGWKTWSPTAYLGYDLYGATIGIAGLGEIGSAVARRAHGFGMRILYTARSPKPEAEAQLGARMVEFEELLRESDFVTIHTPLTPETRNLMSGPQFALMKPTAIFVNTARGPVVDQDALVEALREKQIAGAALDVTTPEPLPLAHPLFGFANVVITPHIASASFATRARMAEMAAENIIAVLSGREPKHPVNRPAAPRGHSGQSG